MPAQLEMAVPNRRRHASTAVVCVVGIVLAAAGTTIAGSLDDPYPEIQPSNRAQAIEVLSHAQPDRASLTPQIVRARRTQIPIAPAMRRSIRLVSQRIGFPDERIFVAADGSRIHYSLTDSSPDRIDTTDKNLDGVPDLLQAVSVGLLEARALLNGRYDLPSPGNPEIYFAELGHSLEGYYVPGASQLGRRRIVLDATPTGGVDAVRRAVIREWTYATLLSGSLRFPIEWAEALATWAPNAIDGKPDLRTLSQYSRRVEQLERGLFDSANTDAAGNALWFAFIEEYYGASTIRVIADELSKGGAISAGMDRALRRSTKDDLNSAFREFHLWTLLTGERADRYHFGFARELQTSTFSTPPASVPTLSVQTEPSIYPTGANQIRLVSDATRGGLHITFEGEFSTGWSADVVLLGHDRTKRRIRMQIEEGRGEITVPVSGLREAWLLIRNDSGDGDAPRRYSYAADIDPAFPYRLSELSATPEEQGVSVTWETSSEHGLFGFNVLRARADGAAEVAVNPIWVPALGTPDAETSYRFLDADAKPGVSYLYRIEGITTDGLTSRSEPVSLVPPTTERRLAP